MNMAVVCPSCGQSLLVPAAASGSLAQCPRCKSSLVVDGASGASSVPPPQPASFASPSIQIDTKRTTHSSTMHERDWRGMAVVLAMLILALALLPVVVIVVGGALSK